MLGIIGAIESLVIARHQPEEIGIVARSANSGMIAARELDQLIIFHPVCLVNFPIGGLEALHAESLLRVKKEIVDLFQNPLCRHRIHIMLVGRETGPVTRGDIRFAHG